MPASSLEGNIKTVSSNTSHCANIEIPTGNKLLDDVKTVKDEILAKLEQVEAVGTSGSKNENEDKTDKIVVEGGTASELVEGCCF